MVDAQGFLTPEIKPTQPEEIKVEKPETAVISEAAIETVEPAQQPEAMAETPKPEVRVLPTSTPVQLQAPLAKDEFQIEIEELMSKDLTDVFLNLPANKREAFRLAGEEAARKIKEMVDKGKVKVRKVLEIIRDWLRIIPGVNKFFLEQEAKIKTDQVLRLIEEKKKSDLGL